MKTEQKNIIDKIGLLVNRGLQKAVGAGANYGTIIKIIEQYSEEFQKKVSIVKEDWRIQNIIEESLLFMKSRYEELSEIEKEYGLTEKSGDYRNGSNQCFRQIHDSGLSHEIYEFNNAHKTLCERVAYEENKK